MPLNAPVGTAAASDLIVKVAITLFTSAPEPQVKITDEFYDLFVILNLSDCPGLEKALEDSPLKLGFFRARTVNNKVVLDERVPDQDW